MLAEPLVIAGSRTKALVALVLTVGFLSAILFVGSPKPGLVWLAAAVLFLLFAGGFACQMISPNRVVIEDDGFTMHAWRLWAKETRFVAWSDIDAFYLWTMGSLPLLRSYYVRWVYRPGKARFRIGRAGNERDVDGSLPPLLAVKARQLFQMMNQRLEASRS